MHSLSCKGHPNKQHMPPCCAGTCPSSLVTVTLPAVVGIWKETDHQESVWCNQAVGKMAETILDWAAILGRSKSVNTHVEMQIDGLVNEKEATRREMV